MPSFCSPYALITAGASLHRIAWDVVLPRFARALTQNGTLAIVGQEISASPWDDALQRLTDRSSTNRHHRPDDLVAEISAGDLVRRAGERRTTPVACGHTVDEYVESFHARNGFSHEPMRPERAAAFDAAATALVGDHRPSGRVDPVVTWGVPGTG